METLEQLRKRIGKRIKFFRKERNLTQEELSEMIDIDSRHLGGIERGIYTGSLKTLNRICNVLDIEFEDLVVTQKENQIKKLILNVLRRAEKEIMKILWLFF